MPQATEFGSDAIATLQRQRGLRYLGLSSCPWDRPLWRVVQALPWLGTPVSAVIQSVNNHSFSTQDCSVKA